jgi:putative membrane-bound dehydrogenase-like protein
MSIVLLLLAMAFVPTQAADEPKRVMPVPGEGMQVRQWAAHPLVHDPVAIDIDPQGRVYVAETGRQDLGVVDNRTSTFWVLEDLASQSIDDRLAYFKRHEAQREGGMDWYSNWSDQIRRVEDTDGDGTADTVKDFSPLFNGPLDGTGAGVLWRDGAVWYTCIPHLWKLEDADEDGVAERRQKVFSGFGVRTALSGHDMHGLVIGPDGRLYWSIGDRGYNVTLPDGTVWKDPHSGAIFRCEQDGSNFEVYATGLRNPQEIAFNQFGDLFTGDNNSDSVDRARLVYIPEGAEIGWDMAYQTLVGDNERGPWVQERLWEPLHAGRPAWSIPPLANIGAGPSGFAFIDGDAVPRHFRNRLLMCDFRGSPQGSLVHAIEVKRKGAGYEVVDNDPFISEVLTTDIDQAWDGSFLVSDWVIGWDNTKTGRLWKLEPKGGIQAQSARQLAAVAAQGFAKQDTGTLKTLLSHPDHRGRTEAHLALAKRGKEGLDVLAASLRASDETMPRVHAIWGLWAMARWNQALRSDAIEVIEQAAWDDDAEVRAQVARVLGDLGTGRETLAELVFDESTRVVAFAAIALGKTGQVDDMDAIAEVLWSLEDDPDPFVRHAAVMGLAGIGDRERLLELLGDPQPDVRLGALLALRRLKDPALATLLRDDDPFIAAEAARAVHDAEINEAFAALAAVADEYGADPSVAEQSLHDIQWARWDRKTNRDVKLRDLSNFEGEPVETRTLTKASAPSRVADNFLARMQGTFTPPMDGDYRFVMVSDDEGLLLVEVDGQWTTASKVRRWVGSGEWQQTPDQTSKPITLKAGVPVRFDARHREGGGNDYLAIGWIRPDGVMEAPIGGATGDRETSSIVRRAVEASLRDGSPDRAAAVARIALNRALSEVVRVDALNALAQWGHPEPRDRVTGRWRPIEPRDTQDVAQAVSAFLHPLAQESGPVGAAANRAARALHVALDPAVLQGTLSDAAAPVQSRIDALRSLAASAPADVVASSIDQAIADGDHRLQWAALPLLHARDEAAATTVAGKWIRQPSLQRAAIAQYGRGDDVASLQALRSMRASVSRPENRLDLLEALVLRGEAIDPASRYAAAIVGGNATDGERIVRFHASAQCIRCHAFDGMGGVAGPDLSDVGLRLARTELLESLLQPQAVVADGFGEASAMPAVAEHLTPMQVRDVVAWLSARRKTMP